MSERLYVRNQEGKRVHRADCQYALNLVPWYWARGFTAGEIAEAIRQHRWLVACKVCKPDQN